MLKVDIIYSGDIHEPNGASVLMKKLMEANELFAANNVDQRLFSPSITKYTSKVENTPCQAKDFWLKKIVRFLSKYSLIVSYLRYRRSLINPAKKAIMQYDKINDKGDVVVFHELWTCYEYLLTKKESNKKIVLVIHGEGKHLYVNMPRFKSVLMTPLRNKMHETIINGCHSIGFDADLPRRNFCEANQIEEDRTFYVYNGVEERPCPQIKYIEKLRLICVATLSERKNQLGILNAISRLNKDNQEQIELVLVGDGPVRMDLEKKANGLYSTVTFMGSMKEKDYYELMLKSNCFCLFSKSEGLPIAILEAMRAGLPIIGSNVAGIPEEIEDGKTGFVVDLDENALSERIEWLINHLSLLPEMGRASYNLFKNKFTMEAMVKKYVEIYKS